MFSSLPHLYGELTLLFVLDSPSKAMLLWGCLFRSHCLSNHFPISCAVNHYVLCSVFWNLVLGFFFLRMLFLSCPCPSTLKPLEFISLVKATRTLWYSLSPSHSEEMSDTWFYFFWLFDHFFKVWEKSGCCHCPPKTFLLDTRPL